MACDTRGFEVACRWGAIVKQHLLRYGCAARYACAAALCALVSLSAGAQDASPASPVPSNDSLNEIVVVANRAPEELSKVGNSVTVLTDADIKASQLPVLSDLLAQTPGLTVARTGGVGQPTSVFIRGAESDQTVVLIDGVQIYDPSTPSAYFDFENLLSNDITRVEILRGAQSTLYGSQAMGGVIDITTGTATRPLEGSLNAEGGSHNSGDVGGSIGGKTDTLMWHISGTWLGTSGIPAFDEKLGGTRLCASQIGGATARLVYDITPDLDLDVRGYYVQSRTDFDGYDTPPNYDTFGNDNEYGKNSQLLGYAGLTLHSPDRTLTNRIAYHYVYTDTREYDPGAPKDPYDGGPGTETFYGVGHIERGEYQGTWQFAPDYRVIFGAQHERSSIDSDSPAYDFSGPMPIDAHQTIDSGYAQVQGEVVRGLTLTAGERYDRQNEFGSHTDGSLAAAWALNDAQTILRSSFGQGFKSPSLYQLYSNYGTRTLRPEAGETWDAGVEQHTLSGRLDLSATYFQRYSRDLIEFYYCEILTGCPNPSGGYYANIARAAAHGVELQATLNATDQWTFTANYTLTETADRSPGSATYGNALPLRPEDTANASAVYRWSAPLTTSVTLRYAGPSYNDVANDIKLGGYVLADVRASYAVSRSLEIYARVENLTGKHYETEYQYGTLSRSAYGGVRASF
jgi:vitamin B12 transporter